MNADELDRLYTALSEALGRVGETHAALLLATLALELLTMTDDEQHASDAIARAERLCKV